MSPRGREEAMGKSVAMRMQPWAVGLLTGFTAFFAAAAAIAVDTFDLLPSKAMAECDPVDCDDDLPSWCPRPSRFLAGADYLLIRPSFSNSTAMYQATKTGGRAIALTPVNYNFDYTGGLRGFLGYRLSDDTIARFGYTAIDASTTTSGTATGNYTGNDGVAFIGPFLTLAAPVNARITSTAKMNLDMYDMELVRRFEIDREPDNAPRWDTAGSAGIRFLDTSLKTTVDNYCPLCPNYFVTTERAFSGVGPRIAVQGRRYLGEDRRWSAFATGGAALLVGTYRNFDSRLTLPVNGQVQSLESQQVGGTIVVPNVDLSLGGTWQMGQKTTLSAGWMLMWFGDLGYSETIQTTSVPAGSAASSVPLTNSSLAYDGFFFRLTQLF
jgi:hypothetical protein